MSKGTISAFFNPAPKPAESAEPAAKQAESGAAGKGFELRFSKTSKVVEWDTGLLTDCRPSERDDAMDDTRRQAKQLDHSEDNPDCDTWIDPALTEVLGGSVDEANAAAKRAVDQALREHTGIELATQEGVANGELPAGYRLPLTDSVAKEVLGTGGRGTYSGSVPFFCDPFGADVWTVCVTEFTVRVVVEGDRSAAAGTTSKAAAGKRPASKPASKAAKASKAKAGPAKGSAPRTTAVSKSKPRGRGAAIVSVPGMSKKQVAALNKSARSSMRKAVDSDSDDGHSGLAGRSAAFWEKELL